MRTLFVVLTLALAGTAAGQAPSRKAPSDSATALDSTKKEPIFLLQFQQTTVTQGHPAFHAKYSGHNSLETREEGATSLTATFFLTARLLPWLKVYINPELAGGAGVSRALGVAGFMNGETFRVGNPSPQFYLARGYAQVKRDIGENGSWHLEVGKFSLADFFDLNAASHDPRSRFLNWALMSNGAWDYPANTRGYTVGAVAGIAWKGWALQAGVSQVPSVANGPKLDNRIGQNRGQVLEVARSWGQSGKAPGTVRLLGFYNTADMGSYTQAVSQAAQNDTVDIQLTRQNGRNKYGFGLSADQRLPGGWVLFSRVGWNDGHHETWAFTEIDQTASLGVIREGTRWKRPRDVAGAAIAVNGISVDHRKYLQAGGTGFMLGDGGLTYGQESAIEVFYMADIYKDEFFATLDYQFVQNPGYNQDRGPVNVFAIRIHTEF